MKESKDQGKGARDRPANLPYTKCLIALTFCSFGAAIWQTGFSGQLVSTGWLLTGATMISWLIERQIL